MNKKPLNVVLHVVQPEYIERVETVLAFGLLGVIFAALVATVVGLSAITVLYFFS